jgi:hypothetical protein
MAKKTDKESTELVVKEETSIAAFDYGDLATDVGQVAAGYEGQTSEDYAVPFIKLMQPGSPQVAGQVVEGIAAGQYYHTLSQRIFKNPKGMLFIIAGTRHEYLEFTPEKHGGGFVGRHAIDSDVVKKAKATSKEFGVYFVDADGRTGDDGNELTEVFSLFGVWSSEDGEEFGQAILTLKSTSIKTYKAMMQTLRSETITVNGKRKQPPLFSHVVRFTTEFRQREKFSWWEARWAPANGKTTNSMIGPDDPRFQMAHALNASFVANEVKVDYSKVKDGDDRGGKKDDDAPF